MAAPTDTEPTGADAATEPRPLRYLPPLDGLRTLAALAIILGHAGSINDPSPRLLAQGGSLVITMLQTFFITSGFLIYRPLVNNLLRPRRTTPRADQGRTKVSFGVFVARRFLRIFPLYWAALAVMSIVRGPGEIDSPIDLIQVLFLLPLPDPMVLLEAGLGIAVWTLAVELPFYVAMPLFAKGTGALARGPLNGWTPVQVQLVSIGSLIGVIGLVAVVAGAPVLLPLMSLPIGMFIAVLEVHQWHRRRRYRALAWWSDRPVLTLVWFATVWQVAAAIGYQGGNVTTLDDIFLEGRFVQYPLQILAAVPVVLTLVLGRRSFLQVLFSSAPFRVIAPLTYGTYLWHPVVLYLLDERYGPGLWVLMAGTVAISLLLAAASMFVIEIPMAVVRSRLDDRVGQSYGSVEQMKYYARTLPPWMAGPMLRASQRTADSLPPEPPDHRPTASEVALEELVDEELVREGRDPAAVHAARRANPEPVALAAVPQLPAPGPTGPRSFETRDPAMRAVWCEPIDGFRAICACLAVMGHTFLASGIFPFAGALHVLGILVALFFAISAFVLYQPFIEADVRRIPRPAAMGFYTRRLLRIYPLFAFALTMYLILLPEVRPDNWWAYARLYLFLQIFGDELSGFKGLPSAWYLCNEVIFYFLIPPLAFLAARWSNQRRRRRPEQRLAAHIAIGWGMVFFGPLMRTLIYAADVPAPTSLPLSHLEFFGFGIVIAGYTVGARMGIRPPSFFLWVRRHTLAAYALVLVPVLMLVGIAERWGDGSGLWQDANMEDRLRFFPYLLAVILLMSAAALGKRTDRANSWLSSERFKPLSALALHIYLWHQLVLGMMNKALPNGIGEVDWGSRFVTGALLVGIALTGSILVSWITQPFTDYPYERYRTSHGMLRRRASAGEVAAVAAEGRGRPRREAEAGRRPAAPTGERPPR